MGDGFVQITNRANLQVRAINEISFDVLEHLQAIAVASQNNEIDHLADLPPKFSVGFDGGEAVSIANFHNEILFVNAFATEKEI